MATSAARIKAIGDAVINATATTDQLTRLGRAVAARMGRLAEYDAATQADKARLAVDEIRRTLIGMVREFEGSAAAQTASKVVDSGFTETV